MTLWVHLVPGSQNLGSCRKSGHHIENPVTRHKFHFGSTASEKVHEMIALEAHFLGHTITVFVTTMPSLHTSLLQGCLARQGKGATRRGTQHTISSQPAAVSHQPAACSHQPPATSLHYAARSLQPSARSLHYAAKGITPHPPVAI